MIAAQPSDCNRILHHVGSGCLSAFYALYFGISGDIMHIDKDDCRLSDN